MADDKKMRFHVESVRLDAHASRSTCKPATIVLHTDMSGNVDAFNPAELQLYALTACMIEGIERVLPASPTATPKVRTLHA